MEEKKPAVSIIIPTYNRANSISRSVNSILNQTYKDFEIIVIDDGSTDNTEEIISAISDERVKYYKQKNAGACSARNYGIELSRGEYIAFHDSDDIWYPQKLDKEIDILKKYSEVDVVFCKLVEIKKNNNKSLRPSYFKEGIVEPVKNLFGIGTITVVGRAEVFEKFKFDEDLPRFQEFELLYRVCKQHKLYCIDEGLAEYNLSEDSISAKPDKLIYTCKLLLKKHPEMRYKYPQMIKYMAGIMQYNAIKQKKIKNSFYRQLYVESLKLDKSMKSILRIILLELGIISDDH